jgi:F-type H+-transporting ATPase subunit b
MINIRFPLGFAILTFANQAFGSEAGMPQLKPEFWISQVFWLILIFSTLYLIIWKIFLPKITYSIENRKSRIVNDLDEAQKLKERAEEKLKEYNEIIEKSKKEAKKIIEDSKKKLDEDIKSKKQKFNDEIEKELIAAEDEIKNLKKTSILNIGNIASETTIQIMTEVIKAEVNKSNVSAIVNDITKKNVSKYI